MNFLERFFEMSLFRAEGKTGRRSNITNRVSQFRCTIANTLHIYRRPAKFLAFLQTVELISRYCLSDQQSYTRGSLADTNALISEIPDFKYHAGGQSVWISLLH